MDDFDVLPFLETADSATREQLVNLAPHAAAEIEQLRAKVAKADVLAMCLEDTVGYFAEFDGLRKRAKIILAAYREADQ